VARQWRCLEAGCDVVVIAETDERLVEAVNAHVRDAHDSYELEDVILAGAQDAGAAAAPGAAAGSGNGVR
jgi:hypothetical protein